MAPPTPVYTAREIRQQYAEILAAPVEHECLLRSITQHECTFRVSPDSFTPHKIICLPFKRLFQRCLVPTVATIDGKKVRFDNWTNIEVTDEHTNRDLFDQSRYGDDVKEFMAADRELQRYMGETEYLEGE